MSHLNAWNALARRAKASPAAAVLLLFALVFGFTVPFCGFYLDDYYFLLRLTDPTFAVFWREFFFYVPGRNMQILFGTLILKLSGGSEPVIHSIALALDLLNLALAYRLAKRLSGLDSIALPAALIFAFTFNHGETHFWFTATLQNLCSTSLVLLAFLAAAEREGSAARRFAKSLAIYTAAFFTYDQVCVLWPLLLATAYFRTPAESRSRAALAGGAAFCAVMNAAHLGMRYLSPLSSGGRPLIQFGRQFRAFYDTLQQTLNGFFKLPSYGVLPHWSATVLIVLAAAAAAALFVRVVRALAEDEAGEREAFFASPGLKGLLAFSGAWWVLSYVPNYFNFLSPRHGYLPSFGFALAAAAGISALVRRFPASGRAVAFASGLLLANALVYNAHEGTEWVAAGRLHRGFAVEARKFAEPFENVLLVGGPRTVGRVPGFRLMHEAALNAALDRGLESLLGDILAVPSGRGAFFYADLSSWPKDEFLWVPYEKLNIVAFTPPDAFRCARTAVLRTTDGRTLRRGLRESPGCSAEVEMDMEVTLLSAGPAAVPEAAGASFEGLPGVRLARAAARPAAGGFDLDLIWVTDAPVDGPLAFLPFIEDSEGRVVYEPFYDRTLRGGRTRIVRPFINDALPPERWKKGTATAETYRVRLERPLPPGPLRLRIELYRVFENAGPRGLGTATIDLAY